MKLFKCDHCGQLIYFENSHCEKCGHLLGFNPIELDLHAMEPGGGENYTLTNYGKEQFKYCSNHQYDVCNWLVPADSPSAYCRSCELNHTIPNLSDPEHIRQWGLIEVAKHRLIYTLLQLKLPLVSKAQDLQKGLSFDFLTDENVADKVLTGHEDGLITLNIAEADDEKRELFRKQMNEPYRTLLGHFRHEVGHYYWDQLIDNSVHLDKFRQLFGDDREDYGQALQRHYANGAPADWQLNFISSYASSHPWEDWAETWAHYLHIMDTLETASAFGLRIAPKGASSDLNATIRINPYDYQEFNKLVDMWLPLTFAMNSLNRSMGNHDMYPFVIQPKVIEKLGFIHQVCYASRVKEKEMASTN